MMDIILCLDYGDRYIGLAATDYDGTVPHRYGTIDQKELDAILEIEAIIEKENIQKILVGVPISLEGNETEQTHKSLQFIEQLREAIGPTIEVEGVDETLTSVEAARLIEFEQAKPDQEHAEAARIMLEDYLKSDI